GGPDDDLEAAAVEQVDDDRDRDGHDPGHDGAPEREEGEGELSQGWVHIMNSRSTGQEALRAIIRVRGSPPGRCPGRREPGALPRSPPFPPFGAKKPQS